MYGFWLKIIINNTKLMKGVITMGATYSFQIRSDSIKMVCKKCGGTMKKKPQKCRYKLDKERLIKCVCNKCGNTVYITEEISYD